MNTDLHIVVYNYYKALCITVSLLSVGLLCIIQCKKHMHTLFHVRHTFCTLNLFVVKIKITSILTTKQCFTDLPLTTSTMIYNTYIYIYIYIYIYMKLYSPQGQQYYTTIDNNNKKEGKQLTILQ